MGKSLAILVVVVVTLTLVDCSPRLKKLPSITYDALREYEKRHGGGMRVRDSNSDLEVGDSDTAETGPIATSVAAYTAFNAIRSMRNLLRSSVATPTSSSSNAHISTREVPSSPPSFSQYSNVPKYKSSSGLSKETPLRSYEPQEYSNDYEVYQSAPGSGPQGRINYVLMPFRVMRNVASGAVNMGKTFASTFSSEFKNHYHSLANDLTERILPEAANYWGVWTQPPHVEKGGYNNWMDGV